MSTCKHGSFALAHENATLVTSGLKWLGVKSVDLFPSVRLSSSEHIKEEGDADEDEGRRAGGTELLSQGLLRMTARDRRRAVSMLKWSQLEEDEEVRRELQVMLMLGIKAEMQILDERPGGLAGWLRGRLASG